MSERCQHATSMISARGRGKSKQLTVAYAKQLQFISNDLGSERFAMLPETRYAKSGDVHIAYQVIGNGPIDLVFVPGFISHVDHVWDEPRWAGFLERLASFSRLICFDKRGTGLSDRVSAIPTLEERMDDVRAVMDAVGSERAALFGISEGGPMSLLFAATYPERTVALTLFGSYALFPTAVMSSERLAGFLVEVEEFVGNREARAKLRTESCGRCCVSWLVGAFRAARRKPVGREDPHANEQRNRHSRCFAGATRPHLDNASSRRWPGERLGGSLSCPAYCRRSLHRIAGEGPSILRRGLAADY